MSLLKKWQDLAYVERNEADYNAFWGDYLPKEQKNYEYLLSHADETCTGTVQALADKFQMELVTFVGFLDGINTSLAEEIDLDAVTGDTEVVLAIDYEKLYYNMLAAKADWLYNLAGWDALLTQEKRAEIKKTYNSTRTVVKDKKIGRNDPCPCGSGRKYKQCCMSKAQ
ncbi:SEC-C metal-binding domain-containing protein [Anaerotalea alkaliphila]|uniref:SEC-C domain-containing protein n=1 Tax=Anaerotalea alkaliphila TaxID=2662126 RepID=A0A7X5HVG8_9FIRM|nr:SEC-C metal-binding domain-containing protein [Anaerotalea alkaliphila]NDL67374.1 SEC-C domain-containing protein [Anaerotalea alkaliphila]